MVELLSSDSAGIRQSGKYNERSFVDLIDTYIVPGDWPLPDSFLSILTLALLSMVWCWEGMVHCANRNRDVKVELYSSHKMLNAATMKWATITGQSTVSMVTLEEQNNTHESVSLS